MIGQAGETRDDVQLDGLQDRKSRTALMVAAFNGKTECVRILAQKEARMQDWYTDYRKRYCKTNTALMFAAGEGHFECVKVLAPLEKGMKDNDSHTAKWYASYFNKKDIVNYLNQFPEED